MQSDNKSTHSGKQVDWDKTRTAIRALMDYVDLTVQPLVDEKNGRNLVLASAALYRCNRYLKAVDDAVARDLGDTAGGNLRTLYETWIVGHLLLLADDKEALAIWSGSRHEEEKVLKGLGTEIDYPANAPDAKKAPDLLARAKMLQSKLEHDDPQNASMPVTCYEGMVRAESLLSTHAPLAAITRYINVENGLLAEGIAEDCEYRELFGSVIVTYFARAVFEKVGLPLNRMDELDKPIEDAFNTSKPTYS